MTSLARGLGLVPGDLCKKNNEQNLQRYNVASGLPCHCEALLCASYTFDNINDSPKASSPGRLSRIRRVSHSYHRFSSLRAPFSQIAAVPFLLCTLKKQCDEASHLVNLQAAGERTSFSLRGDTSTLRFCGYPSPRREPVNVAEAANPKLDALDHSQAS
jgi:hypothetical protein